MQDCIGAIMIDERDSVATLTEDAELMETLLEVCGGKLCRAEENGACEMAVNQWHSYC